MLLKDIFDDVVCVIDTATRFLIFVLLTVKVQICSGKSKILKEYRFKDFSIYSGNDVFDILLETIIEKSYTKVFVLADTQTEKYCLPLLKKYLFDIRLITIENGEQNKTLRTAEKVWSRLQQEEADKKAILINLGGGMVADIGGFCASTYKRGIDFINIPTTLLAMVDAAIGGKNAVDFNGIKNAVGTIKQPSVVFIHPDFLNTLPREEMLNGYAEMLKHGLILDKEYWDKLISISTLEPNKISPLINGSIKLKMQVVKKDPDEKSLRKILNFGHTIGHAIEAYSLALDKKPLKHGEAVAIGLITEAFLSKVKLNLSNKELKQIADVICRCFPKYSLRSVLSPDVIGYMKQDKKNIEDAINFTLLKKIGKAGINFTCSESQITAALNYYDSL